MRAVFAPVLLLLIGCGSSAPSPIAPAPDPSGPLVVEPAVTSSPGDETPKVVRRLVREAAEQMAKNHAMVAELQDPRGRTRAEDEWRSIERELGVLILRIDNPDSDNLDGVMNELQLLDTRIDLLNDKLRAATERTTAVQKD